MSKLAIFGAIIFAHIFLNFRLRFSNLCMYISTCSMFVHNFTCISLFSLPAHWLGANST